MEGASIHLQKYFIDKLRLHSVTAQIRLPLAASLTHRTTQQEMEKGQYRFKTDYYLIDGVFNIPGLVICSGHGYDFKTYCCKKCGEIFVLDLELLYQANTDLQTICANGNCPKCKDSLQTCLVDYPENIFYNGSILTNNNPIDRLKFENTDLIDVYLLN